MSLAFIRASQRICKYCKGEGHTKPNCPHAFQKSGEILAAISLIQHSGRSEEVRLLDLFNSELLTDLCFLMNTRNIKHWVSELKQNGSLSEEEAKMHYKRDRVKALMLIFWFNSYAYKQKIARQSKKISVKTLENDTDLLEFECPVCVSTLPSKEKVVTGCKHGICKVCLVGYFEHQIEHMDFSQPRCVMCRTNITELTINNTDYLQEITELTILM